MALTISEREGSRSITSGDNPEVVLLYVIEDDAAIAETTETDVEQLVKDTAPTTFMAIPRVRTRIEYAGPGLFYGEAYYSATSSSTGGAVAGQRVISFDTGGATEHISHSLSTVDAKSADPNIPPPDFKGAIGVTDDDVEGVDIVKPQYQWSETHIFPDVAINDDYQALLFLLTGKVNADQFGTYPPGTVLFLGATGTRRGAPDTASEWEITFRFAARPNEPEFSVGEIEGLSKEGWDYLWVQFTDVEDQDSKTIVKRPSAAYVERVYRRANFAFLGLR